LSAYKENVLFMIAPLLFSLYSVSLFEL